MGTMDISKDRSLHQEARAASPGILARWSDGGQYPHKLRLARAAHKGGWQQCRLSLYNHYPAAQRILLVRAQRAWLFTILTPPSTISCRRGTSKLVAPTCFTLPLACSGSNRWRHTPYTRQGRACEGRWAPSRRPRARWRLHASPCLHAAPCRHAWRDSTPERNLRVRRATHLQRRQVLCCLHIPLPGVVMPVELQGG